MPRIEKKDDPSTTSSAYDFMIPSWTKVSSLLGGTDTMRGAGQVFMPQHDAESDTAYNERLSVNTLFNVTDITLESWVGRPFANPILRSEDMPEEINEYLEDIDLQGNNLDVFSREVFKDGLAKAFTHVLVDFPKPAPTEAGRQRTLADDRADGLRPYWVHVKPENLIFASSTIVAGHEVLTHVRIIEEETSRVGFAEVTEVRIREINVGTMQENGELSGATVRIWAKRKTGRRFEWILIEEWEMGVSFIPLATFYADRKEFMVGKSPILDLADLNITHWQSSSDQRCVLTVARFPILAVSGAIDDDNQLEIGPRKWLHIPDPQGKYYYVEHTGKAIGVGQIDLDKLELQMSQYGAEFLKVRPDRESAAARLLDSSESSSPLQDVTRRFVDFLNQLLIFTGEWVSIDDPGAVNIETDFGPAITDSVDLASLNEARRNRDLSRENYLVEYKRRGVLVDGFDINKNTEQLAKEPNFTSEGDPPPSAKDGKDADRLQLE